MRALGITLLVALILGAGFGLMAILTWLLSLLGVFTFTWGKVFIVWGVVIIINLLFFQR